MFYIDNEANTTDKFDMCKFIELDKNGVFDCLNSYMLYAIPQLPTVGIYKIRFKIAFLYFLFFFLLIIYIILSCIEAS